MEAAKKRDELRDRFDFIGLEMEAAGTMNTIPVDVIRGVCDYGDRKKRKAWQPYAAAVAAAYAKKILCTITPAKNRRKEALQALASFTTQPASESKQG
jgi:nucleoside phosphorylase